MTDRYTFQQNSAAQAGPLAIKRVAIGNGEYIGIYRSASGKWMVRDANEWVQPCDTRLLPRSSWAGSSPSTSSASPCMH